jgi:plasmid stabilization system protein ParE
MNQFALNKPTKNYEPACGDLLTMAERELTSFFTAVKALFGSEQAEAAAKDWLHELMAISDLPASTHQWRLFTVKVMARLANRVNVSFAALATH